MFNETTGTEELGAEFGRNSGTIDSGPGKFDPNKIADDKLPMGSVPVVLRFLAKFLDMRVVAHELVGKVKSIRKCLSIGANNVGGGNGRKRSGWRSGQKIQRKDGVATKVEISRCVTSRFIDGRANRERQFLEVFVPEVRTAGGVDGDLCFKCAVHAFRHVSLGVIVSSEFSANAQTSADRCEEGGNKLRTIIGQKVKRDAIAADDFVDKQGSDSEGGRVAESKQFNPACEVVDHDDEVALLARGGWERAHDVDTDRVPRLGNRVELHRVCCGRVDGFELVAGGAGLNVFEDVLAHRRPENASG